MTAGAKRIQHVGVPVSSLRRSLDFYETAFGIQPDFIADVEHDERISEAVGVSNAKIRVAFVTIGDTRIELLEYVQPRGRPYRGRNCDVGAIHICFEVDDVWETYEELRAKGIMFARPPIPLPDGPPPGGCTFAYFKDPDGLQLEIFSLGRAHVRGTT